MEKGRCQGQCRLRKGSKIGSICHQLIEAVGGEECVYVTYWVQLTLCTKTVLLLGLQSRLYTVDSFYGKPVVSAVCKLPVEWEEQIRRILVMYFSWILFGDLKMRAKCKIICMKNSTFVNCNPFLVAVTLQWPPTTLKTTGILYHIIIIYLLVDQSKFFTLRGVLIQGFYKTPKCLSNAYLSTIST